MVTRLHRHLDTGAHPPIEPGPHREYDPLLGRRLRVPGGTTSPDRRTRS
jgi:hypothetical protein